MGLSQRMITKIILKHHFMSYLCFCYADIIDDYLLADYYSSQIVKGANLQIIEQSKFHTAKNKTSNFVLISHHIL